MLPRHSEDVRTLLGRRSSRGGDCLYSGRSSPTPVRAPIFCPSWALLLPVQGQHAEAEILPPGGLRAAPDVASLHSNLGNLLHEQGRCRGGGDHPAPGADAAARLSGRLRETSARTQRALGHLDEGRGGFRAALRLRPPSPNAQRNLASLLTARGRFAEAVPVLEAWRAHRPREPAAALALAQGYRQGGRAAEVARHLRAAPRRRPVERAAALIEQGSVLHAAVNPPRCRSGLARRGRPGAPPPPNRLSASGFWPPRRDVTRRPRRICGGRSPSNPRHGRR